jgi:phage-related protein
MDSFISGVKGKIEEIKHLFDGITNLITEHKGPPAKDKVLLTPAGEWIMQSLMDGISGKMGDLKSMVSDVAPMMNNMITPAIAPATAANGNVISINFHYSGGNPEEFTAAVEGSGLIGRLTSAARSRRT